MEPTGQTQTLITQQSQLHPQGHVKDESIQQIQTDTKIEGQKQVKTYHRTFKVDFKYNHNPNNAGYTRHRRKQHN